MWWRNPGRCARAGGDARLGGDARRRRAARRAPPRPSRRCRSATSASTRRRWIRTANPCDDFYRYRLRRLARQSADPGRRAARGSFNMLAREEPRHPARHPREGRPRRRATTRCCRSSARSTASCMDEAAVEKAGTGADQAAARRDRTRSRTRKSLAAAVGDAAQATASRVCSGSRDDAGLEGRDAGDRRASIQGGLGLPDRDYYLKDDEQVEGAPRRVPRLRRAHARRSSAASDGGQEGGRRGRRARDRDREGHQGRGRAPRRREDLQPRSIAPASRRRCRDFAWDALLRRPSARPTSRTIDVTSPELPRRRSSGIIEGAQAGRVAELPRRCTSSTAVAPALPKRFVDERFALAEGAHRAEGAAGPLEALRRRHRPRARRAARPAVRARRVPRRRARTRAEELVNGDRARRSAENLDELAWMDDATKAKAREKLDQDRAITSAIPTSGGRTTSRSTRRTSARTRSPPTTFDVQRQLAKIGKPVDRSEWQMTPPTVNAYYNPHLNDMVLPRRHPAAAVLRGEGVDPGEPRRHGHGRRPRAHARLRRSGRAVRRRRQPVGLVAAAR